MGKTRLMVVDDSPFAAGQIQDAVGENGYELAACARNGEEAIWLYDEIKPDVVIMDIVMPGIDGLETARLLLEKEPDARIIMLSSLCDEDTLAKVRGIGLKYLIPKPWEDDVLLATLELVQK